MDVDSRGYSIYDPARAIDWIPTIERHWLSIEEQAIKLNLSVNVLIEIAKKRGVNLIEKREKCLQN